MSDPAQTGGAGDIPAAASHAPVPFTVFTLENGAHPREAATREPNLLCRLAARTGAGQFVCGQGCGMKDPAAQAVHACPFGLQMLKVAGEPGAGRSHWIGRRFTSAAAMHKTLEKLLDAGIGENAILDHLPGNPIVTPDELAAGAVEAAAKYKNGVEAIAPRAPEGVGSSASPSDETTRAWNVIEYLEQIQALLQSAKSAGEACTRFLHGMACLLKFREMAIYLDNEDGEGPTLEALVDHAGRENQGRQLRARTCRLEASHLGACAMRQRRIMVEIDGRIEPFVGRFDGFTAMAIPFPGEGEPLGVWIIKGAGALPLSLGPEPMRLLRLQTDLLAQRLDQIRQSAASERARQALTLAARTDYLCFLDALNTEIARAQRHETSLAVLCIMARGGEGGEPLPIGDLSRGLRQTLRPYDHMLTAHETAPCWFVAMPLSAGSSDERIAMRMIEHFENLLDAQGGFAECGARLGVGLSQWSVDVVTAMELMEHARSAAAQAMSGDECAKLIIHSSMHMEGAGVMAQTGSM